MQNHPRESINHIDRIRHLETKVDKLEAKIDAIERRRKDLRSGLLDALRKLDWSENI